MDRMYGEVNRSERRPALGSEWVEESRGRKGKLEQVLGGGAEVEVLHKSNTYQPKMQLAWLNGYLAEESHAPPQWEAA